MWLHLLPFLPTKKYLTELFSMTVWKYQFALELGGTHIEQKFLQVKNFTHSLIARIVSHWDVETVTCPERFSQNNCYVWTDAHQAPCVMLLLGPTIKWYIWELRCFGLKQRVVVMGLIGCPETSVRNYHYTLRNSPEERSYHLLRGGSLKLRNDIFFLIFFVQRKYVLQVGGQITEMFP
jgi:hypothetical protein